MNHFSTQDDNKASRNLIMVIAFILLSIGTSFGQTAPENNLVQTNIVENNIENNIVNTTIEINAAKQETTSANSNMNFVLWFMGSKQTPNATTLPIGTTAKRQFMTSGTAPNRLLIKAFLKKAINFECAVV